MDAKNNTKTEQTEPNAVDLLTPYDVATCLKIGKSQAYKLVETGEIPSVRIGRLVRIRTADLHLFIEKNVRGSWR